MTGTMTKSRYQAQLSICRSLRASKRKQVLTAGNPWIIGTRVFIPKTAYNRNKKRQEIQNQLNDT